MEYLNELEQEFGTFSDEVQEELMDIYFGSGYGIKVT